MQGAWEILAKDIRAQHLSKDAKKRESFLFWEEIRDNCSLARSKINCYDNISMDYLEG